MKTYTFEDWQNDKIDYRIPGGQNILEASNGLTILYFEKLISKKDYEQIKKHQLAAYNTAVELTVKSYIKNFQETYNGSPYKTEYLNNKIRRTQELIDKDLDQKNNVLAGLKNWSCIKGSQYHKIMKEKDLFDNGKFEFSGWALNDNMRITTLYKYLQWLIKFQKQQEPKTEQIKVIIENEFKTMDDLGWEYAFTFENDYIIFVDLLAKYFENKSYILPKNIIKLKRNCKTRFAKVLNSIHKDLSKKSLKSDHDFIKIIKILDYFKDCSEDEIYQAITR